MAKGKFTLDGIIFERILSAVAESSSGEMLYRLPQLTDATIDVSAETKDSTDAEGTLIKRSYRAKAATLTATNAHLDLNAYATTTGTEKIVANAEKKVQAPKMILVNADATEYVIPDGITPIDGTMKVVAIKNTGSMGDNYELAADSTATDTAFAYNAETSTVTFPTNVDKTEVSQFLIKFEYETETAVMVENRADKWPKTVKLTVQALCYDECEKDVLRLCYVIFPSFQVSPETSLQMTTDATFEFKGDAQVDICSKNKRLYYIVMADNDIEEDDE